MNASDGARESRALWARIAVLAVAVAACYANSLRAPFLMDDPLPDVPLDYSTRPLVWATFALNRAWSGSATWSYHLVNVGVHLACGLALLGVLRRAMAAVAPSLAARTRADLAYVTTLLWLVHPLQTSAITYLSQRAEALGAFFTLLAFYAYLRAASQARGRAWLALAFLALVVGLATKELVAVAPVLLFLLDALFLSKDWRVVVRTRGAFFAAVAVAFVVVGYVFLAKPLLHNPTMGLGFEGFGPLDYARTQPGVLLHYLKLVVWPYPQCFDYAWPIARAAGEYVPQGLVILALLAASLVGLLRRSWIGYVGTSAFLVLAPTSSFIPIQDAAFEHRLYLPLAGLLLLFVVGVHALCTRRMPQVPWLPAALACAATLALGALTVRRNHDYRSAVALLQATVRLAPHNARAHIHLGGDLLEEGRVEEALPELHEGLRLDPSNGFGYLALGKAYLQLDQVERALPFLERAVELVDDPRFHDVLGGAFFLKGEPALAVPHFEKAIAAHPEYAATHRRLAEALAALGRGEEAEAQLAETLRLEPADAQAHAQLADLRLAQGRAEEALAEGEAATRLAPATPAVLFTRGQALRALGRWALALEAFRAASALAPELPEPYAALAQTVGQMPAATADERRAAVQAAQRAVELTQRARPELLAILAEAQARAGDLAGALASLETALALPAEVLDAQFRAQLRAQRDDYRRRKAQGN